MNAEPTEQIGAATVFTHRRPSETAAVLAAGIEAAARAGVTLRFDPEETAKHKLTPRPGVEIDAPISKDVDLCIALGGDGTILRGLRAYADTGVPTFGVNFGEIGFLATIEPEQMSPGFRRAIERRFDVISLPALTLVGADGEGVAVNDVAAHRKPGNRVAELAYAIGGETVNRVRCDGLVVSTPAGSTGYNLANGGPVMAWGVEGFAISFVAPHSLSARVLVVGPDDVLSVHNRSSEEAVDVSVDGRPAGEIAPGGKIDIRFGRDRCALAQLAGATFYGRLREKFGRLSA